MKRIKRVVDTGFWSDEKVLDFTPEDKYFMLFLLTNEYTTQLGIYYLPIKKASFDLGYSLDAVGNLLDRFENKYRIIKFSKKTSEIALKNYLTYSVVSGGKPVFDCLCRELDAVKDKSLVKYIYDNLSSKDIKNDTILQFIDHLSEFVNDIDNDNDNERHVDESYNESYPESYTESEKSKKEKPTKHKYGEYKHVLLTDKQYEKLIADFGEEKTIKAITKVDNYCQESGKRYSDYNLTIRRWGVEEDKKTEKPKPQNKFNNFSGRQYDTDSLERALLGGGS